MKANRRLIGLPVISDANQACEILNSDSANPRRYPFFAITPTMLVARGRASVRPSRTCCIELEQEVVLAHPSSIVSGITGRQQLDLPPTKHKTTKWLKELLPVAEVDSVEDEVLPVDEGDLDEVERRTRRRNGSPSPNSVD
jgi:hypothetical protein